MIFQVGHDVVGTAARKGQSGANNGRLPPCSVVDMPRAAMQHEDHKVLIGNLPRTLRDWDSTNWRNCHAPRHYNRRVPAQAIS